MGKGKVLGLGIAMAWWAGMPALLSAHENWSVQGGKTTILLDAGLLEDLGVSVVAIDDSTSKVADMPLTFGVTVDSSLTVTVDGGIAIGITGEIRHDNGVTFATSKGKVNLDGFAISSGASDLSVGLAITAAGDGGIMGLELRDAKVAFDRISSTLLIESGELVISGGLADALGRPDLQGLAVGALNTRAFTAWSGGDQPKPADAQADAGPRGVIGPDVIVGNLYDLDSYGSSGGISAFAVGTISCNKGDQDVLWISNTNQHPVIGQTMFRLKDGRFEQVGQSWLKHAFTALTGNECNLGCIPPGTGSRLGVGCSDPYSAGLNGSQGNLGPKYQVNAHTGDFPYPPANPAWSGIIARRLQVHNSDLDPAQAGGGTYFVESQYVAADDSAAGNQNNNASYRQVTVSGGGENWSIALASTTQREQPAIRAWKDTDSTVTETDVQVSNDGLFIVSAKATSLGGGQFHYEYAVQNLNSDRSAQSFSVPVGSASVTNIGFHDVDYHSGEPFSGTDWSSNIAGGVLTWSTQTYAQNQNANALRWATLYNFRFDSTASPSTGLVTLGLFKTGTPASVTASTVTPATGPLDCNTNGVDDSTDIANGTSQDCNGNNIPDECETFPPTTLTTIRVATGLSSPVFVCAPPGDSSRLFIVEQFGQIKILTGGSVLGTPFLNISGIISAGGERGLLSMAFHPNYSSNGFFYVNYTNTAGNTVIARYTVSGNPDVANAASAVILKTITQDFANHNGGQLQFGPDGYLYCGMGDGGSGNDPNNRAQNTGSLLGKMLRLDVDSPPNYIPASNPFVGAGNPLDEIWALGMRNPWRFSFDRLTGDMYIGDVGQDAREEIDFQPASSAGGENYGWRCMEGFACTGLSGCTCNGPTLTLPILDYSHVGSVCTVIGGYVYRGCAIPDLSGTYFYAEYCADWIKSFRYVGGAVTDQQDRTVELTPATGTITTPVSFGEDADGELYIVTYPGDIYKIVPSGGGGPVCGNGILEAGEQCDDGNTTPGDGCDGNCQIEPGGDNDACANATPIGNGTFAFDTTGATTDGPDEPGACSFFSYTHVENDIWYCYTASCTGTATATLCGSSYDTKVAIYAGCTCPTVASAIACNDDSCSLQSEVSFPTTQGNTYLIRIGGYNGATGAGTMTVSCSGSGSVCGNGILEPGEECDDGNTTPGDGCDANCMIEPVCGNGILEPGEECDDGNTTPGDGCDANCMKEPGGDNNNCADAFEICPGTTTGSTTGATNDGSANCGSSSTSPDVWYHYTPSANGTLVVETCTGSNYDTVLSIHSGCPGTTGNQLNCNDDACGSGGLQSRISRSVIAGTTYIIRVTGYNGATGDFTLTLTGPACLAGGPDNDDCADAIAVGDGATNFDTSGATTDGPDEPGQCNFFSYTQVGSDIWYCYTASCTGTATVSLCGSGYDTKLAVYDGCVCPATASAIACNDDSCDLQSEVSFPTTSGNQYLIRVGGYNALQGTGVMNISCQGAPDCNGNGVDDAVDISSGTSEDCNGNGIPDECDLASGTSLDCDGGPVGVPADGEQIVLTFCFGCHGPDGAGGPGYPGPNLRGKSRVEIWNKLLPPTDHPGGAHPEFTQQDFADLEAFLSDTGSRGRPDLIPDECQTHADCNANSTADGCDLENGPSVDLNYNGVPDECDPACSAPELLGVRSVATHDTGEFYLDLDISNTVAGRTSEPRSSGIRILDIEFDQPITSGSVTVTPGGASAPITPGAGTFGANGGRATLAAAQANDVAYTITISASTGPGCDLIQDICVTALVGDFDDNDVVTAADKGTLVGFIGQTVTQTNARFDVSVGGGTAINAGDLGFWTGFFGTSTAGDPCP